MSEIIYINGKKYNRVAEMPKNIRDIYNKLNRFMEDNDKDGVPDMIQTGGLSGIKETVNIIKDLAQFSSAADFEPGKLSIVKVTDSSIFINGKTYSNIDEMPASVRQEYDLIVNHAQDGKDEIFDEAWRQIERDDFFEPHDDEIMNRNFSNQDSDIRAPIEMVDSTNRFIILVMVALVFFGCIAAAWFLI